MRNPLRKLIHSSPEQERKEVFCVIDIGTTKVAMLAGVFDKEGKLEILEVEGCTSQGLLRGTIVNQDSIIKSLSSCLAGLRQKIQENPEARKYTDGNFKTVIVGISCNNIKSFNKKHKILRSEKRNQTIRQEDVDKWMEEIQQHEIADKKQYVLHVIPQFYYIDRNNEQIESPVGYKCGEITLHYRIITVDQTDIETTNQCLAKIGLTAQSIIFEPIASAEAVLTHEEKELGVAVLDIGGGTSDLVVYSNNSIVFSCVFPMGGNLITEDIKKTLHLSKMVAEKIKIEYGSCLPNHIVDNTVIISKQGKQYPLELKILSEIIEFRVKELLESVYYKLFYENNFEDIVRSGLVITGGGALIKDLVQCAKMNGFDARIGYPNNKVRYSAGDKYSLHIPQLSTLLGLPAAYLTYDFRKHKQEASTFDTLSAKFMNFVLKD